MIYRNLRSFMDDLRRRGDLVEITAPVDAHLELAEIHRRVIAAGGPALLFTSVRGKNFPVVTNLFGTKDRVELAFGSRPKTFIERVAALPDELMPPSLGKLWKLRGLGLGLARIGMKNQWRAPVLAEQIPGARLTELPALTSWKEDGGPFLTLPLVHTHGAGKPDNLGMYRVQIHEDSETGLHFQIGKGGGYHLQSAEAAGKPLPVNIYLGGPPALILAAIAPLPENVPEVMLASLVMGEKLGKGRLSRGSLNPDPVAEAEFCLVGESPPGVRRPEGPFGDHYGYYSLQHDYPVFRPRAIYHRKGAVFPATVVGKPRQEDFFLGDYLQELLLPLLPKVMPTIEDIWSYGETGYHALASVVLKERYAREALTSVFRVLGEGQLALTKFLLGVDKRMDLRDFRQVLTHVLERVDWQRDLVIFANTAMDTLDYAGPQVNKGSKGVILGLGAARRELPREFRSSHDLGPVRKVRVFSPGCLIVEVPAYEKDAGIVKTLAARPEFADWPMLVATDNADRAAASVTSFLWTTFTRFEPAADIHSRDTNTLQNKIVYGGPILFDARFKPWYPGELFCDDVTARQVSGRWQELFPGGRVAMGDSDDGHLLR